MGPWVRALASEHPLEEPSRAVQTETQSVPRVDRAPVCLPAGSIRVVAAQETQVVGMPQGSTVLLLPACDVPVEPPQVRSPFSVAQMVHEVGPVQVQ